MLTYAPGSITSPTTRIDLSHSQLRRPLRFGFSSLRLTTSTTQCRRRFPDDDVPEYLQQEVLKKHFVATVPIPRKVMGFGFKAPPPRAPPPSKTKTPPPPPSGTQTLPSPPSGTPETPPTAIGAQSPPPPPSGTATPPVLEKKKMPNGGNRNTRRKGIFRWNRKQYY